MTPNLTSGGSFRRSGIWWRGCPVLAVGALALAGCSTSGAATPSSSPTGAGSTGRPLATGTISSIGHESMIVQDPRNGQVTVSWSEATRFTQTIVGTSSDLSVGECAQVVGLSSTPPTARSIAISEPTSSGCVRPSFGRGAGGGRPGGGSFDGGAFSFSVAFGRILTVGNGAVEVQGTSSTGSASTSTFSVTTSTMITKQESTTASSAVTGQCATAYGSSATSGVVSASVISLRAAGSNGCFGGGGFGGGGTAA